MQLTEEEKERLSRDKELRDKLIIGHMKLVSKILKSLNVNNWEDNLEYGMFLLVEAVNKYTSNKGDITPYIYRYVRYGLMQNFTKNKIVNVPRSSYEKGKDTEIVPLKPEYYGSSECNQRDNLEYERLLNLIRKECPNYYPILEEILDNKVVSSYQKRKLARKSFKKILTKHYIN